MNVQDQSDFDTVLFGCSTSGSGQTRSMVREARVRKSGPVHSRAALAKKLPSR